MTLKKINKGLLVIFIIFFNVNVWSWEMRSPQSCTAYDGEIACFFILNKNRNDIMLEGQYIDWGNVLRYTLLTRKKLIKKGKGKYDFELLNCDESFLLFVRKENTFKERTYFIFLEKVTDPKKKITFEFPHRWSFQYMTIMENLSIVSDKYMSTDFRKLRKVYNQMISYNEIIDSKEYFFSLGKYYSSVFY